MGAERVVASLQDSFFAGAGQDQGGVLGTEPLAEAQNTGNNLPAGFQRVLDAVQVPEADVAGAAVVLVQVLAEVVEDCAVPAGDTGAVVVDVVQLGQGDFPGFRFGIPEDVFPDAVVSARVEQAAFSFQPVAAGPPVLLLVSAPVIWACRCGLCIVRSTCRCPCRTRL